MGKETTKAFKRRLAWGYFDKYLVGHGIDIGAGDDLLQRSFVMKPRSMGVTTEAAIHIETLKVDRWDKENGDAQLLQGIKDNVYDFVYSSHCLEHLDYPNLALANWIRVLKPSGYLFIVVPDEMLYEQGVWPSRGNGEHKTVWNITTGYGGDPWPRTTHNHVRSPAAEVCHYTNMQIKSIQLIDDGYNYERARDGWFDQSDVAEVGIELIAQKYPWTSFARP